MAICNDNELMEQVKAQDKFIVYGKLTLIRILLRDLKKKDLLDKVDAVSIQGNQKREGEILGRPIKSMKELSKGNKKKKVFLVESNEKRWESAREVLKKLQFENVKEISYDFMAEIGSKEHVHLDFLCVGFVKCGTSSLHAALKKNKKVFLPKKKETLYLSNWKNRFDDSPEKFNSIYFPNVAKGQVVGNVEPSYHARAEDSYECYGSDMKVIFMVRNPVSATYSYFKMLMRKTEEMKQINYYKKYPKFDVRMFDDYIADYITSKVDTRFCYMDWIDEYLKYYDKENVKVIIFEEFIKDPKSAMDDIQEFIGVEGIEYGALPHSNEGKSVSKNYISAKINRYLYRRDRELRYVKSDKVKRRHEKWKAKIHKHTLIDNNDKMLPESKAVLDEFYKDSIKRLEEFCGKSLEGIWY